MGDLSSRRLSNLHDKSLIFGYRPLLDYSKSLFLAQRGHVVRADYLHVLPLVGFYFLFFPEKLICHLQNDI